MYFRKLWFQSATIEGLDISSQSKRTQVLERASKGEPHIDRKSNGKFLILGKGHSLSLNKYIDLVTTEIVAVPCAKGRVLRIVDFSSV